MGEVVKQWKFVPDQRISDVDSGGQGVEVPPSRRKCVFSNILPLFFTVVNVIERFVLNKEILKKFWPNIRG